MLQQRWYQATKITSDSMAAHIAKIEDLAHKLRALGENMSDSIVITKILMTLPTSYNHFITAWESTSEPQRTLGNLTERLLAEEMRSDNQEDRNNEALAALNLSNKSGKGNPVNSKSAKQLRFLEHKTQTRYVQLLQETRTLESRRL